MNNAMDIGPIYQFHLGLGPPPQAFLYPMRAKTILEVTNVITMIKQAIQKNAFLDFVIKIVTRQ
jgi:hypothetical protein